MIFFVTISNESATIGLPTLSWISQFLGISKGTAFTIVIDVRIGISVSNFTGTMIYGRTDKVNGMNTSEYPSVTWDQTKEYESDEGNYIRNNYFGGGQNRITLTYKDGYYAAGLLKDNPLISDITLKDN